MANGNHKNGNGNGKPLEEYTREELIALAKKLRKQKRFGLVWEDKPEDVAVQCKTELPVLEQDAGRAIEEAPDQPTNFIIEGDNYHALSVLNYTHGNKIDVIYIDPPYNTGNQSWKYNNKYVDRDDPWKHSLWLSFMRKRLLFAKSLLKDEGIIIVAIDDYELFPLGMLMDELFGEHNRLANITVLNKKSGRTTDKFFATCHEYYLVYAKNIELAQVELFDINDDDRASYKFTDEISPYKWRDFLRTGGYSTPKERPNSYYPIYYQESTGKISIEKFKGAVEILPIDSKGQKRVWRQTRPSLMKLVEIGDIKIDKNRQGKYAVRIKDRLKDGQKPKTVWDSPRYDAATHGTKLLEAILGKAKMFDFPKSLFAVFDALKIIIKNKKDAVILDFFAGSGTTGHAVLALNNEDGGHRQFILCTNNENNIAEEVTYPRIKKVIDGVKKLPDITGIPANVRYFKTAFVPRDEVSDNARSELVKRSTEMICVRENTFTKKYDNKEFKIYTDGKINTGILFDLEGVADFRKKLDALKLPAHIYVFSLSNDDHAEDFKNLEVDHTLCPIPESILEVYRRLFGDKDKDE